ncbi:MAG: amino acid ABC transporter permease [Microbacterium sp.]|uniref:amino acid ABC transporter permease n=1 Tax=Microbacterium sp. TaxID=51671 RepID=UPI0039E435C4
MREMVASNDIVAIPQRHWGRKVAGVFVAAAALWVVSLFVFTPNINWETVWEYLTFRTIIAGIGVTIVLTVISMIGGAIFGVIAALMRLSQSTVLRTVSWVYLWVFRGTPFLVQIIFWYNLALFLPRIGWGTFSVSTNVVMTSFVAASIALTLNSGAIMAEIIRGGILSVDAGQSEAATALGMSRLNTMFKVVLPQAFRVIVPATGNHLIGMLKETSLVSVIAAQELLTQTQIIYGRNYQVIELLIVASFWYLVMTSICTFLQQRLEARLALSVSGRGDPKDRRGKRRRPAVDLEAPLTDIVSPQPRNEEK